MSMKEELAALKKKRDAGEITAFKFRQGTRKIKKKYGVDEPSIVSKLLGAALTPSPRSAKAVAAKKKAASGSKGGPGRPAGTGKKPPTKKSPAKKSGITAPTSKGLYTIKSGDTLSQIAKARGTTIAALKKANNITDVNKIRAGRKLKVPATVGKSKNPYAGETKSSMAAMIKKTAKPKRPSNAEIEKMSTKELEALAKRIGLSSFSGKAAK